ncbi:MAG: YncE family protein [Acidobacteriales bacterium]|nr:YncE family protein [Terriglobales bacterium]
MSQHYQSLAKWLFAALSALLLAGCGNEFRPVAIPIIPPGGTPQPLNRQAIVVSTSSQGGTATNINVGGNTVFAVRDVGPNPVHAGMAAGLARTVVVNDNDTLTTYLTFGNLNIGPPTTITLPPGSDARFAHSRDVNAYVALHAPDPDCSGNGSVAVVSMSTLTLSGTVCAGDGPIALAEVPNGSKLYVANELSNDVTVINTADRSIAATIPVGSTPSAIDVSADGTSVFVANKGSGTVTVIDVVRDIVRPNGTVVVGSQPTFLKFDDSIKRVYVVNSGSNSVSLIDANPASATFLASPAGTLPVGSAPVSVTALANGTKAYVANSGSDSVTVIDAFTQTVIGTIPVGTGPVAIDSSIDSAQVLVADNGPAGLPRGNVTVIRTSDDTKMIDIPLPPPPSLPPGGTTVVTPKLLFVAR